jgi:hypothetical protein
MIILALDFIEVVHSSVNYRESSEFLADILLGHDSMTYDENKRCSKAKSI